MNIAWLPEKSSDVPYIFLRYSSASLVHFHVFGCSPQVLFRYFLSSPRVLLGYSAANPHAFLVFLIKLMYHLYADDTGSSVYDLR